MPIKIVDEVSGVKASVDFDEDIQEFILDLNDEPFESYLFLDSSFSLESSEI